MTKKLFITSLFREIKLLIKYIQTMPIFLDFFLKTYNKRKRSQYYHSRNFNLTRVNQSDKIKEF